MGANFKHITSIDLIWCRINLVETVQPPGEMVIIRSALLKFLVIRGISANIMENIEGTISFVRISTSRNDSSVSGKAR